MAVEFLMDSEKNGKLLNLMYSKYCIVINELFDNLLKHQDTTKILTLRKKFKV